MFLLVGIDTEGDNQWDAAARTQQTFENLYALPRLHALFARHGVRPTYVITHPVATDPRSAEVLRRLLAQGDCEIGAHHHVWETPPCTADDVRRHAYASTLPRRQFEDQLTVLTAAIESAVGVRPVSYRSGRFGFSADHVAALEQHGYLVESSVAPLFYEAHKGGPEFVEAPLTAVLSGVRQRVESRIEQPPRSPGELGAEPPASQASAVRLRPCATALHDQAPASTAGAPASPLAAALVFVARGYEGAGPGSGAGGRARAQSPLPFERGDRRRQPVQPHPGRARCLLRSARAISGLCHQGARRPAGDIRRVPTALLQLTRAILRILHVTPHLPPDQAANALLPWQLGLWATEAGDNVEYVAHPPRAGQPAALPGPASLDTASH